MIRALAVFAPTLLFIFVRPGRIKEVWFAAAGALLAWLLGLVSPDDAISLLRETGDVLLFLAGMLVVAYVTDRAGVFERLALWTARAARDRKSTRLNSSHVKISYAVFCLKKKRN